MVSRDAVAVLCCRKDSVYKTLPGCEVYDADRDMRTFAGGMPIIAHPPCAQWGKLSRWSNDVPDIKALAPRCVELIREHGGILEHPEGSKLWPECALPEPDYWNTRDRWGGWTLAIHQYDFGHLAQKKTRLYIVGVSARDLPPMPLRIGEAQYVVCSLKRRRAGGVAGKPSVKKADREHTPLALAVWLVDAARRIRRPILAGQPSTLYPGVRP